MFSRVSQNPYIFVTGIVQGSSDCLDLAVNHGRRCDHVSTCYGMTDSDLCQVLQRLIVLNESISQYPAVAVVRVMAHADISEHCNSYTILVPYPADGLLDNSIPITCR